jgi:molybdenum cofactor biosynthesis protein MoaC
MTGPRSRPLLSGAGPPMSLGAHPFSTSVSHLPVPTLTHIDSHGNASMVDVGDKQPTNRTATAVGRIYIPRIAYELVASTTYPVKTDGNPATPQEKAQEKSRKKGDALTVAQLAAIMGSKKTSDLIPLCHPLPINNVTVDLIPEIHDVELSETAASSTPGRHSIVCRATVSTEGKTGVEMEALTAVSVGLLTVWDMLKAVAGKEMEIGGIYVSDKSGGRSGDFHRDPK